MLAIFLNSFFYYFINFSILLFLLFIKFADRNVLKIFILQKKKILITFLSFVLLSLPFLIQFNFGENDYFRDAVCLNKRGKIKAKGMNEIIEFSKLPIGNIISSPIYTFFSRINKQI